MGNFAHFIKRGEIIKKYLFYIGLLIFLVVIAFTVTNKKKATTVIPDNIKLEFVEKSEFELKHIHNENGEDKKQTVKFKKFGSIEVKKVDSQDGQLIQATMKFGLFKNGELIEEVLTKEGIAKFNTKLIIDPKIVYEVKELEAPERYMKSDEILKVVLTEDDAHQVKVFSYNNTLLPVVKITPQRMMKQIIYYLHYCQ